MKNKKQILAGNKIIALAISEEPETLKRDLKKAGTIESMHYHDQWDWIMPALKKVREIGIEFEYDTEEAEKYEEIMNPDYLLQELMQNDILAVFERVVEFFKWYNQLITSNHE